MLCAQLQASQASRKPGTSRLRPRLQARPRWAVAYPPVGGALLYAYWEM